MKPETKPEVDIAAEALRVVHEAMSVQSSGYGLGILVAKTSENGITTLKTDRTVLVMPDLVAGSFRKLGTP